MPPESFYSDAAITQKLFDMTVMDAYRKAAGDYYASLGIPADMLGVTASRAAKQDDCRRETRGDRFIGELPD